MSLDLKIQEKIGWKPHVNQEKILASKSRDVVICAGRRFGKSAICAYVALRKLLESDLKGTPCKIWIVSPTYDLSKKVFEYLSRWYVKVSPSQAKGVSFRQGHIVIKTGRGSIVECKSADNPTSLLGEELDLLIIDECSRIKEEVYRSYLYPTTVSRQAQRFFISTPFGKNWFYDQWMEADKEGGAFQFKTTDNPYWTVAKDKKLEWEKVRKQTPPAIFEREFEAVFTEGFTSVFRGVREAIVHDCYQPPTAGRRYIMGLDLAKFEDYSVATIIDKSNGHVVHWDRFHRIPYTLQKERIHALARKYHNARIVIDGLNVGSAVADELRALGLDVNEFKTVGQTFRESKKRGSKNNLIEKLSMFIEDKMVGFPAQKELIEELEIFTYRMTEKGNMTYGAPPGKHDDCVISLALAVWTLPDRTKRQRLKAKRSQTHTKKQFQYL